MASVLARFARPSCPLDCPDTCTLAVTVDDGRHRRRRRRAGEPAHAGLHLPEGEAPRAAGLRAGAGARLRSCAPGRRARASSGAASWDEALDLVAARIRRRAGRRTAPRRWCPTIYNSSARGAADRAADAAVRGARRVRSRRHDLRGDPRQGVGRDVRRHALGRPARRRARAAGRRLGREPDRLQHPLPAAGQRGPAERARSSWSSTRAAPAMAKRADLPPRAAARHRRRARAGDRRQLAAQGRSTARSSPRTPQGSTSSSPPRDAWTLDAAERDLRRRRGRIIGRWPSCSPTSGPAYFRVGWGLERNRNGGSACVAPSRAAGARPGSSACRAAASSRARRSGAATSACAPCRRPTPPRPCST